MRCKILQEERSEILSKKSKGQQELDTQQQVIDTMLQKKTHCQSQMKKLQEEVKLIETFIQQGEDQRSAIQQKLTEMDQ